MTGVLTAVVVPILATVAIGYFWAQRGYRLDSKELTALIGDIATPCLIVHTFQSTKLPFEAFAQVAVAAASAIVLFALSGALLLTLLGLRLRTFLPSLSFPNAGNLGLPVALYAFGPEGLGYAIAFFATSAMANFTLGQAISAGSANWRGLLRTPILYAVIVGVGLSYGGITLPQWLGATLALIGGMTVPLMLLMLGSSLSLLRIASFPRAALVTCIRFGLGITGGLLVTSLLGMTGIMRAVFILQCANPVAVYNYLFAQRWNNEPEQVAGVVVLSTFVSLATVPLLLIWLKAMP
ncbi:MAG: AEC family transporter [Beijerinckiaceae bacterium]